MLRFFRAARGVGCRISPPESMDAMSAVAAVGYDDKARLRDALLLTIAKTQEEKQALGDVFELFFKNPEPKDQEPSAESADQSETQDNDQGAGGDETETDTGQFGQLAQMLMAGDRSAVATAMAAAADRANLSEIRYFTQRGLYSSRILDMMGMARLEEDIEAQQAAGNNPQRLINARDGLREAVRDMVNDAITLYTREGTEALRNEVLRNAPLARLERQDIERTRKLVAEMARRLRDRYNKPRRKKNRGQLDTRRTIRRNASWGGVPFITVWKQKRIEKPKIVALCDVSGSVARVAEFLLLFLYSLNEALSDIHTYAFSSRLVDVSDILDGHAIDKAMQEVMKTVGYGSSDYGKSLEDFEDEFMGGVTNSTTVIILGDGRNNNLDPRTDILRRISERARRVIWLNPEPRYAWGTGDSEMPRYEPYCTFSRQCGTVRQLERVVSDLLEMDRH
ncbi:VWA containing CoxE family protein [Afipia sp. P52-10]|nr:VWA containing CoxE family protein [Afipia sp. P52-10]